MLRNEILRFSHADGLPHPALVSRTHLEILNNHYSAQILESVFGCEADWSMPSGAPKRSGSSIDDAGVIGMENGQQHLELNGIRHWVRVAGAALNTTPLVIVHGGPGGSVYTFEQTAGLLLEQSQTIIYCEQRGCGRSSDATDPSSYTVGQLVDDLEQLRQALELNEIDLLGFSFGAELALEYAAAYPQSIRRVVAHAPANIFGSRIAAVQLQGFATVAAPHMRDEIEQIVQASPTLEAALEQVWSVVDTATVDRFLFQDANAAQRNRTTWLEFDQRFQPSGAMARAFQWLPRDPNHALEILPSVHAQTLVLTGRFDRNGGAQLNREVAELLPNSSFAIFEHSAHFPDIEETNLYCKIISDFLNTPSL